MDALQDYAKVDEVPYDFGRKGLSVMVRPNGEPEYNLVCKGVFQNVVEACSSVLTTSGTQPLDEDWSKTLDEKVRAWSTQGYHVLGIALRRMPHQASCGRSDEVGLTLVGFLLFLDPAKGRNAGDPGGTRGTWNQGQGHHR